MITCVAGDVVEESHWNSVYQGHTDDQLSWFQDEPTQSLRLIQEFAPAPASRIVDAGVGRSLLVDHLLERGYRSIVLLDLSVVALDDVRLRLGSRASGVQFLAGDVTAMDPIPNIDVWHDRAVFHFMTAKEDRDRYISLAAQSVRQGGFVILAVFAKDGPTQCSGLPVCRYEASEIGREFRRYFTLIHHENELHLTPSGTSQPFVYVVLKRV